MKCCKFADEKQLTDMMTVEEYRKAILAAMLSINDKDGNPKVDERTASKMLQDFTDSELEDGILFNTPEEVAELLVEG